MRPHFEDIQAHYDLSDDFFGLFQDPSRTYSCAYFEPPDLTLEAGADRQDRSQPGQARPEAGHDAARHRLRLGRHHEAGDGEVRRQRHRPDAVQQPARAHDEAARAGRFRAHLTRSSCTAGRSSATPSTASCRSRPSSTSASSATTDFFKNCFDIMPDDGRMTIQSTTSYHPYDMAERGKDITFEGLRFVKFIITEIFPGGRIPTAEMMQERGENGRIRRPRGAVAATALHQDTRHLGRRAGGQPGQGHRDPRPKRSTTAT